MRNHGIAYMDTQGLEIGLSFLSIGNNTEDKSQKMDKIMQKYNQPLSNSEKNKLQRLLMNSMINLNPYETEAFNDRKFAVMYLAGMEVLKQKRFFPYSQRYFKYNNH